MTVGEISTALASIDDRIIEECAEMHLRYATLRQNRVRKLSLTFAASVCVILIVAFLLPGALYPNISLTNANGNIHARYVPGFSVKSAETDNLYPYKTEQELFAEADLIFSGTVTEIRQIKMDFDGVVQYYSLITVEVDECFKGTHSGEIKIKSEGFGKYDKTSTAKELLYQLEKGQRGVFLAKAVTQGEIVTVNGCSYDASQICDARFFDGYRFGFLESKDGKILCTDTFTANSDKVFVSLNKYNYESVIHYTKLMISKESDQER